MSRTFSFVCDDCKKQCWAGQSDYIYKDEYIFKFLHDHKNHRIRFVSDDSLSDDDPIHDYEEIE